jgi:repressor of nif and glnA expression
MVLGAEECCRERSAVGSGVVSGAVWLRERCGVTCGVVLVQSGVVVSERSGVVVSQRNGRNGTLVKWCRKAVDTRQDPQSAHPSILPLIMALHLYEIIR